MTGLEMPGELLGLLQAGDLGPAADWLLDQREDGLASGMAAIQAVGRQPAQSSAGAGWTTDAPKKLPGGRFQASLWRSGPHCLPAEVFHRLPAGYDPYDVGNPWRLYATKEDALLAAAAAYGKWFQDVGQGAGEARAGV